MRACWLLISLLAIAACSSLRSDPQVQGVFFIHAEDAGQRVHPLSLGLPARVLRDHSTGSALLINIPPGWAAHGSRRTDQPVELYLLAGELSLDGQLLVAGDWAGLPAGTSVAPVTSDKGAEVLVFADPPVTETAPAGAAVHIVGHAALEWVPGTAMSDAGRDDVPLEILHLKNDPSSGARTYLVRVKAGLSIPWEVHKVAEEAFVVEGDFTIAECLNGVEQVFEYRKGGYFYRPPGIAHNGPRSGTRDGVTMLIRTPGPLTVALVSGC